MGIEFSPVTIDPAMLRVVYNTNYLQGRVSTSALFYESWSLLVYTGFFLLATHLFVVWYEEPTLRRTFGPEYEAYCRRIRRWWPIVRNRT